MDISARRWQVYFRKQQSHKKQSGQWSRAKSFDTFAPIGPKVVLGPIDYKNCRLKTILNGSIMQNTLLDDMIWDVRELIAFLSQDTTLMPGTIILTGTPNV